MEESKRKKRSTGLLLAFLGVFSLVLITVGVTYAFFNYAKEGTKENKLTTGAITFLYSEDSNNFTITDALPIDDVTGMTQNDNVFTFNVTSTTPSSAGIDYVVTARGDSTTIDPNNIKMYLTQQETYTSGSGSSAVTTGPATRGTNKLATPVVFGSNTLTAVGGQGTLTEGVSVPAGQVEKIIYTGNVPANSTSYNNQFAFRMWLNKDTQDPSSEVDFSPYEFVLKTVATNNNVVSTTALDAPTLIAQAEANTTVNQAQIIKSTEYYYNGTSNLDRSLYERIAFVDITNKKIYTVAQATALNLKKTVNSEVVASYGTGETEVASTFEANEQYYQYNGQEFSLRINVYANGVVAN